MIPRIGFRAADTQILSTHPEEHEPTWLRIHPSNPHGVALVSGVDLPGALDFASLLNKEFKPKSDEAAKICGRAARCSHAGAAGALRIRS